MHYILFRKSFALYFNATVLSSSPMAIHNTNAAHQIPVHRQRHRISRQEMLRRKRAIRRRKRIARFFRISVAVLLLLTAVSFWQDYGGEILPTVNHLYYQLTARYDLPVSKYDFAALQEENETTFAESLSSVDAILIPSRKNR